MPIPSRGVADASSKDLGAAAILVDAMDGAVRVNTHVHVEGRANSEVQLPVGWSYAQCTIGMACLGRQHVRTGNLGGGEQTCIAASKGSSIHVVVSRDGPHSATYRDPVVASYAMPLGLSWPLSSVHASTSEPSRRSISAVTTDVVLLTNTTVPLSSAFPRAIKRAGKVAGVQREMEKPGGNVMVSSGRSGAAVRRLPVAVAALPTAAPSSQSDRCAACAQ